MAEDIDGDNLAYSIASSGKLVCSLIERIMADDIDGDNLTYSEFVIEYVRLSPSISSAIILPIRLHTNLPELAIEYVRLSPSISSAIILNNG
jgi:hypothetical protein